MYTWVYELTEGEWIDQLETVDTVDVTSENITPSDLPSSTTHTGWTKVGDTLHKDGESEDEWPVLEFFGGRPPITRPHVL